MSANTKKLLFVVVGAMILIMALWNAFSSGPEMDIKTKQCLTKAKSDPDQKMREIRIDGCLKAAKREQ